MKARIALLFLALAVLACMEPVIVTPTPTPPATVTATASATASPALPDYATITVTPSATLGCDGNCGRLATSVPTKDKPD